MADKRYKYEVQHGYNNYSISIGGSGDRVSIVVRVTGQAWET